APIMSGSQRSVRYAHETRKWTSIVRAAHATLARPGRRRIKPRTRTAPVATNAGGGAMSSG
ncbi:MAG: hypothetical protein ACREU8_08585, partial [Gammaproteobacteria bacterium]